MKHVFFFFFVVLNLSTFAQMDTIALKSKYDGKTIYIETSDSTLATNRAGNMFLMEVKLQFEYINDGSLSLSFSVSGYKPGQICADGTEKVVVTVKIDPRDCEFIDEKGIFVCPVKSFLPKLPKGAVKSAIYNGTGEQIGWQVGEGTEGVLVLY